MYCTFTRYRTLPIDFLRSFTELSSFFLLNFTIYMSKSNNNAIHIEPVVEEKMCFSPKTLKRVVFFIVNDLSGCWIICSNILKSAPENFTIQCILTKSTTRIQIKCNNKQMKSKLKRNTTTIQSKPTIPCCDFEMNIYKKTVERTIF